jgi:hypothetical protein
MAVLCCAVLCCTTCGTQGIPTVEAVAAALRDMGPILTGQLSLLQDHLDTAAIGEAGKKELKMRVLQVRLGVGVRGGGGPRCVCGGDTST